MKLHEDNERRKEFSDEQFKKTKKQQKKQSVLSWAAPAPVPTASLIRDRLNAGVPPSVVEVSNHTVTKEAKKREEKQVLCQRFPSKDICRGIFPLGVLLEDAKIQGGLRYSMEYYEPGSGKVVVKHIEGSEMLSMFSHTCKNESVK